MCDVICGLFNNYFTLVPNELALQSDNKTSEKMSEKRYSSMDESSLRNLVSSAPQMSLF